jgi:hypothetical protein
MKKQPCWWFSHIKFSAVFIDFYKFIVCGKKNTFNASLQSTISHIPYRKHY